MKKCSICKRPLNSRPELLDCGGDCLECMALCGDPDAIRAIEKITQARRDDKKLSANVPPTNPLNA
jgi:hypothetical protein